MGSPNIDAAIESLKWDRGARFFGSGSMRRPAAAGRIFQGLCTCDAGSPALPAHLYLRSHPIPKARCSGAFTHAGSITIFSHPPITSRAGEAPHPLGDHGCAGLLLRSKGRAESTPREGPRPNPSGVASKGKGDVEEAGGGGRPGGPGPGSRRWMPTGATAVARGRP